MPVVLANAARLARLAMAQILQPPPPVDFEEWATSNIVFDERESPLAGPYNPNAFPYFSEILRALGPDDPCRFVTFAKSAQLGGTVLANIFVLGASHMAPSNILYVHPTEDNARRWSRMKLAPMLMNTRVMRSVFSSKSRDGADSVFYKERMDGRGAILISGANSPASLSMISIRRQVQDDLSKWDINAAGDPEQQADSRSRAEEFAKVFKISTPMVAPGCRITRNFLAGSQEHFEVPCPHCDEYQTLDWENFQETIDDKHPEKASFTCKACGALIMEHNRPDMLRRGRWVARNPQAGREHRSFYLWSAYSPLQSFERIAREYLKAQGDPAAEQVFLNDTVGKAYQAQGEAPPWEMLRQRADDTGHKRSTIPVGGLVVTVGVDCQKDFVAWQAVAWSRDGRRFVIDHGIINGHISEQECRDGLDDLLKSTWRNAAGRAIGIDRLAIDGNDSTEDVFGWARRHPVSKVIMVRGVYSEAVPLIALVKKERDRKTGKLLRYSRRFFNINQSVFKMGLYRNLMRDDPLARGYVGIPSGLADEYFLELTAERRKPERQRDGFIKYRWVKVHQKNEMLDTMVQAEAAATHFGVRDFLETRWDRLEAEREMPLPEAQLDLEDHMAGLASARPQPKANEAEPEISTDQELPEPEVATPQPQPKPPARQRQRWSAYR
ncbi:phage terminase large subunit family protein [Pseudochelatococcus sp. G4_1912]|uniref:phage terminase large subunit family protein n=1 Tax=Pseudochelatococcus sp. G4_1912 TaxID=3114288 RepID=UPI0039C6B395